MIFISYSEWRKSEEERLMSLEEPIECVRCAGGGESECECTCGHTHDAECPDCDGIGTSMFDKLPRHLREKYLSIELYEETLFNEARQLASWVARDVFEVLVESGFNPWMGRHKHSHLRLLSPETRRAA